MIAISTEHLNNALNVNLTVIIEWSDETRLIGPESSCRRMAKELGADVSTDRGSVFVSVKPARFNAYLADKIASLRG